MYLGTIYISFHPKFNSEMKPTKQSNESEIPCPSDICCVNMQVRKVRFFKTPKISMLLKAFFIVFWPKQLF
jgi:hypothetical protein